MKKVKLLADQFLPHHYRLTLSPDKKTMAFTGSVVIQGKKIGRPSNRITLHQKNLKITSATIQHHTKQANSDIHITRINTHETYDEVRLHTEKALHHGEYTLVLEFEGTITRAMNGLYPCFFTKNGSEQQLLATQFESHHAREVFPCIDEPSAKAVFDLTIISPKGETVISNTPIASQTSTKQTTTTVFEPTPIMSTYLLAFVIGELAYKEKVTKDGVAVRAYATPQNIEHTTFALDIAVKTLEFFNDYFDIPYPLKKCDLIALPDFASGAMENWGCITFREHALFVDPKNTSLPSKQYVALVVAHELAHQWFGNLVTMRWWTDLWLNEGFASWIEYLAIDKIFPEWKLWTQFIVDEQQQALKLDALEHTHPVEVPIKHPDEIRTIFDAISYSKGASVIHMLHEYLGAKDFQAGLRYYLKKHAYKNTDTADLWDALEEASEKPVKKFMHAWTSQSGYPLVTAHVEENQLKLSQERFYVNDTAKKQTTRWPVPLLTNDPSLPDTLTATSTKVPLTTSGTHKLNANQSGFYRTFYNPAHLYTLMEHVSRGKYQELDRLGIIADAFEASKAGHIDAVDVLNCIDSYANETSSAVWDVLAGGIASVRTIIADEDVRENMKPYVRHLIAQQQTRLGWNKKPGESYFDQLLRPTILSMAAAADDPDVVSKVTKIFDAMHAPKDAPTELRSEPVYGILRNGVLDPDMRTIVYGTVARNGSDTEFNKLVAMHNASESSEERLNLCMAIAGFKQKKLTKRALSLIKSEHVRLQDVAYWLAYSFSNRFAHQLTWEWVKDNWQWLQENLGNDLAFYRLPIYAARPSSDRAFLKEYTEFFNANMSPAFERSIQQGIEMITWQARWREHNAKSVRTFFAKKSSELQ